MALIVTSIMIIFAFYVLNTLEFNRLIINATENSIQANYSAESKLYLLLNKDEYYHEQLMPRIERFVKYGRITPHYDARIILNKDDLIVGDNNNVIKLNFTPKNNRQCLELIIDSNKNNIAKSLIVELFLVNELFEMELPIISNSVLIESKKEEFINYMRILQENMDISKLDEDIAGIYVSDYDEINVIPVEDSILIQYFRNGNINPIKEENIIDDQIFLCIKNNETNGVNVNFGNSLNKISTKGVIYVEGDLNIYGDIQFSGIIIVNGKIIIHPEADVNVNGIIFAKEGIENLGNNQFLVVYDFLAIKRYGTYIPNFIDVKLNKIKSNWKGDFIVELKNIMEDEVKGIVDKLLKDRDDICTCERCKMDIAAIVLNNVKPKYVVTEKGEVFARIDMLAYQYDADITMEVIKAIKIVGENPNHA